MRCKFFQIGSVLKRAVEVFHLDECFNKAYTHPINGLDLHFSFFNLFLERSHRITCGHFKILSRFNKSFTVIDTPPIRHDKILIAEFASQESINDGIALPTPFAVELIVCSHHGKCACIHAGLEGREINLMNCALGNN